VVISALKKLIDKNIPAKLYIAGTVMDSDYKESLVRQVGEFNCKENVVFKGFLSDPRQAMLGLDTLVLPSRREAFGLVLIEAMRSNVAVIGTNDGGVPEILDHNKTGLLFEWNNPDQLAECLEYLYKNPHARVALARNGQKKADEQFSSELHFKKLEKLFKGL
jgi:glycosyltransferase involved in cell wall biosynthesis